MLIVENMPDHVCALRHHARIELFILLVYENARFPVWKA